MYDLFEAATAIESATAPEQPRVKAASAHATPTEQPRTNSVPESLGAPESSHAPEQAHANSAPERATEHLPTPPPYTPYNGGPLAARAENLSPSYPKRSRWGTAGNLRAWQQQALEAYRQNCLHPKADGTAPSDDFLAVATPGAGKTTFALRVASELLDRGIVNRITVVAPTEHLKTQWADASAKIGINIDPNFQNANQVIGKHYDGVALTYAQVAANPELHLKNTKRHKTLVILDEIHHGGDALSWGDGIKIAFAPATKRLSLTGTPFRSDTAPIPFVTYEMGLDNTRRSKADYIYGYTQALKDKVVRPVLFMTYSGLMRWKDSAGEVFAANLGEAMTKAQTQQAWRTALSPEGEWIPAVLRAADQRLTEVRRHIDDAGGLVIASDQAAARDYAELLAQVTGKMPTVVLSDDGGASQRIDDFSKSKDRWMVAVRMVSEGVDVPRLAVGVYATNASTPLYFAQAVGRFVRARSSRETATVFLPSVGPLLELAREMEAQREHALDSPRAEADGLDDAELAQANREEKASDGLLGHYEALESQASFDSVLFDGGQFGLGAGPGTADEHGFLELPGLLDADTITDLLRQKQAAQAQKRAAALGELPPLEDPVAEHRRAAKLRKDLSKLVSAWARTS
ncbi:MAG: DEAD/DEAH box helicase, partial [Cellulomonadaceae bacterium]|nr:DEAD/DEAH box helicase [Cellulomonadaceae bacterium]